MKEESAEELSGHIIPAFTTWRIVLDAERGELGKNDVTMVGMIFACCAFEAFLNDCLHASEMPVAEGKDIFKASIYKKTRWLVSLGEGSMDWDKSPLKEVSLLFDIRNCIVHANPEPYILKVFGDGRAVQVSNHELVQKLVEMRVLSSAYGSISLSEIVEFPPVLEWAKNTVTAGISYLAREIPSSLISRLRSPWR